ncbi:hypothetical protein [Arthrobacter psychrolactophilus]|nr:hypothetical protein [Arthrobacter psychrolactophilus]
MSTKTPRWARYTRAAVGDMRPPPPVSKAARAREWLQEHKLVLLRRLQSV